MKTYLRHKIKNVIDIKELIALEYLDFEGKYKNYKEAHNFWELCFVLNGSVDLVLNEKEISIGKNQLILLSPDNEHSYDSKTGNNSEAFVVCFECFSEALTLLAEKLFYLDDFLTETMEKIIRESSATFKMNDNDQLEALPTPILAGQQVLLLLLEYLLISLIRKVTYEKQGEVVFFSEENFHLELADAIKLYLRDNLQRKISLKEISEKFNYSGSFICKIFKEQTGETLVTYFNKLKIEKAKKLLKSTTMTVTEIASSLGFSEVKYFDSLFKKQIGVSPITYKNNKKN